LNSAELYDPSNGSFTATGTLTTARSGHTATPLPNGKVLVAGGLSDDCCSLATASAELYDPATGSFTSAGNMAAPRAWPSATLLKNGKILITGGASNGHIFASAELYDPSARTFTLAGNMTTGRYHHTATLLPNGKVWIVPGGDGDDFGSAELYDPETGTFSESKWTGLGCGTAATSSVLTNGKVLVTLTSLLSCYRAELYDPSMGEFTATADMAYARTQQTGVVLPDGAVLITGSNGGNGAAAEVFAPASANFYAAGNMTTARYEHTATLLPDGAVLIAGGFSVWAYLTASAEIYRPPALKPAAALLSLSSDGEGQGAILHAGTSRVASIEDPASVGEVLEIYCTGLADQSIIPPQIAIGGRMAEVLYFGQAPGYTGLNQINVRVPGGVAPGSAVGVRLTYLGRPSNEVTIGLQ
jgi:uncharacterized protein (TIGR03437 family)